MKHLLLSLFFSDYPFKFMPPTFLIPMDAESQKNHLKAYGITYWTLNKQENVKWLTQL